MISPTFVIMILRVTASHHYSERRAFIMPKKVSVKPILELRAAGVYDGWREPLCSLYESHHQTAS